MMELQIRQYKNQDLNAVLSTWESASRLAHPFMSDSFIAQALIDIVDIYIPKTETWVAELKGEVIGFISLMGNAIGALFLQPAHHGQGIGKALMDKAQALHGDLEVEVFKENAIGRKFYDRYGFLPSQESYHEPTGQWALTMTFTANK